MSVVTYEMLRKELQSLILALGYHPDNWREAILDAASLYTASLEKNETEAGR
jgi:hypothetical protein